MSIDNTTAVGNEVAPVENAVETPTPSKKKRGRQSKPAHPLLLDENGERTNQIDAVPADYSTEHHATLQEDDFVDPAIYWDWRASYFDGRAAEARQQAQLCRTFENEEQRKNAQKFASMSQKIEQLAKELGAAGIDLESIKKMMG